MPTTQNKQKSILEMLMQPGAPELLQKLQQSGMAVANPMQQQSQPFKKTEKAIDEAMAKQAIEALPVVGPVEVQRQLDQMRQAVRPPQQSQDILSQLVGQQSTQQSQQQTKQQPSPEGQENLQNLYGTIQQPQGFTQRLFQPMGLTSQGTYSTGGFFPRFAEGFKVGTGGKSMLEELTGIQKLAGIEPMQAGKREELKLEGQKALKQHIATKEIDAWFKQQETNKASLEASNRLVNNMADVVNQFDSLQTGPLRGRVTGTLEKVFGGPGREIAASLKGLQETLLFNYGTYFLNQQGRNFTEREQKALRNALTLNRADREEDFYGKIQAANNLVNNMMTIPGVAKLPNARDFVKMIRERRGQATQTERMEKATGFTGQSADGAMFRVLSGD